MSDEEVQSKFDPMIAEVLPAAQAREMSDLLWSLDRQDDLHEITAMMRAWAPQHGAPA